MNWRDYDTFLIDLDGTIYRGTERIPHADTFVATLRRERKHVLFLTNNATRRPDQVAGHLRALGIAAEDADIFTSAQASAAYVRGDDAAARVFVVGEEGLDAAMREAGLTVLDAVPPVFGASSAGDWPTHVVVGLDRRFAYARLEAAARAIHGGARFIATNTDPVLITEKGKTPGSGSIVAAVRTAAEKEPIVIGKPQRTIVDLALARLGADRAKTVVVGDNLATDIAAGAAAGLATLLVTTGISSAEEAARSQHRPTAVWPSLDLAGK